MRRRSSVVGTVVALVLAIPLLVVCATPEVARAQPGGAASYDVILKSGGGNKLAVVKLVKDLTGLGLKEAKDLVDQAPKLLKSGVDQATAEDLRKQLTSAGAQVELRLVGGPAPSPGPGVPPGGAASYDVILKSGGGNKLAVVKLVKDLTGLGLKEAKDLVDQAPKLLKSGVDQATAEDLKKQLTSAGAQVELRLVGGPAPSPGPGVPSGGAASYDVILKSGGGNKLAVVKLVKDLTGLGLKEAKDLVDQAPKLLKSGVDQATAEDLKKQLSSAGAQVELRLVGGPAPSPGPGAPSGGATSYDVILKSGGGNKLAVVKLVKDLTGLGLKQAKDLVDQAPKLLKSGVDRATAEDLKKQLTAAGADVELRAITGN